MSTEPITSPITAPLPAGPNPFAGEAPGMLFGLPMPMAAVMGLRGEAVGGVEARVRMLHQPDQSNSRGDVHGGAMATLLDCTMAAACRAHDPAAYGVATIDMTLHFIASGRGDVVATAKCERRGRSISFARAELHAEDGTLLALATGTFKLMERAAKA